MNLGASVMKIFLFFGARLLLSNEILEDGVLAWRDEKILYAGLPEGLPEQIRREALPLSVPERGLIVPGFIDIHVHGGNGEDFMDASPEVLDKITSFHSTQGTTAMLATSMTAPKERLDSVLAEVDRYRSSEMPYAQLEGIHLEGPFLVRNGLERKIRNTSFCLMYLGSKHGRSNILA